MNLLSDMQDSRTSEWNRHAEYQWTFFPEREKELISRWLSQRVSGSSNIDLGSGWYDSVPGSVVVDLSDISIASHPAREKYVFDIDKTKHGEKIPVSNKRFETASMISVWQYISDPRSFLKECERILKTGGMLYIINQKGAGLTELIKQPDKCEDIAQQINKLGYRVIIEDIYVPGNTTDTWQAICVKMPGQRQLGLWKNIRDRASAGVHDIASGYLMERDEYDIHGETHFIDNNGGIVATVRDASPFDSGAIVSKSRLFEELVQFDMVHARYLFAMLDGYAPTQFSIQLYKQIQERAHELSGGSDEVLAWYDGLEVELDLATDSIQGICLMKPPEQVDATGLYGGSIWYEKGTSIGVYDGYHPIFSILLEEDPKIPMHNWESSLGKSVLEFLSYTPLNTYTQELQAALMKRMYQQAKIQYNHKSEELLKWEKEFRRQLMEKRVNYFYNLYAAYKQKRRVQKLVSTKKMVSNSVESKDRKSFVGMSHEEWKTFESMLSEMKGETIYE